VAAEAVLVDKGAAAAAALADAAAAAAAAAGAGHRAWKEGGREQRMCVN
jgi:hypothetical protein